MLKVRVAEGEDAEAILELLRGMHDEVGQTELDEQKALVRILEVMRDGTAFVVEDDGEMVASIGLEPMPYWYGPGGYIGEIWFYVARAYRAKGDAVGLLLIEARELATNAMMPVMIDHFRARGRREPQLAVVAERYGFKPAGQTLMLSPMGGH